MAKSFDLVTHPRSVKGDITREQPYTLYIESGMRRFERPPGSGFMYDEQGTLISSPSRKEAPPLEATESEVLKKKLADLEEKERELALREEMLEKKEIDAEAEMEKMIQEEKQAAPLEEKPKMRIQNGTRS